MKWHDTLLELTPVELHGGLWFKREDKFAPLGYGNINGTKLRQCIWLIHEEAVLKGRSGVIHGAVSGSPQHPMVAAICDYYGLRNVDVIGTKEIEGHKTLEIAKQYGTEFVHSTVGYAKTLQHKAKELRDTEYTNFFHLETNITVDHERNDPRLVERFHEIGSHQVKNIPDHIETLIIPAGSCNSVTSVLYGLARFKPKNLKNVILMGIGNYGSKDPEYIIRRLDVIQGVSGVPIDEKLDFAYRSSCLYVAYPNQIRVLHVDVNGGCGRCEKCGTGYVTYNDLMPYRVAEIDFHPRYEGKCWRFMNDHFPLFDKYMNEKTLFWIIGSENLV